MDIRGAISKNKYGKQLLEDVRYRTVFTALCSFAVNLLYALYNGVVGYLTGAYWFCAMCVYHIILGTMRFAALLSERKNNPQKEYAAVKLIGALLSVLSLVLAGVVYICVSKDVSTKHGTITMITIAAYTFYKITMAVIRAVKYRRENSPILTAIRFIGYAEISVSVLTMQMSMLVSFEDGMTGQDIYLFNLLTGIGVCLFTLMLGIIMIKKGVRKNG